MGFLGSMIVRAEWGIAMQLILVWLQFSICAAIIMVAGTLPLRARLFRAAGWIGFVLPAIYILNTAALFPYGE